MEGGSFDLTSSEISDLITSLEDDNSVPFVLSSTWQLILQSIAIVSILSSIVVLIAMIHIIIRHRKYLSRLSLRASGYIAIADLVNASVQLAMLNGEAMARVSSSVLRFIIWLAMASNLMFVLTTAAVAVQLHLSTLTRVRVARYMGLEKLYVPGAFIAASVLAGIAVGLMRDVYWVPWARTFNWPASVRERRAVLWTCNYMWLVVVVVYCSVISGFLCAKIWRMVRDSVEVEVERAPEKWDESSCGIVGSVGSQQGKGYVVTAHGSAVAVRTYVERRRFVMSMQRLALYPVVPIVTQLGTAVMNMSTSESEGLYVFATLTACLSGVLNLAVFALNPALPEVWRNSVLKN